MSPPYKLKGPIGPNYVTDPDDVWVTKRNLNSIGYYKKPSYGMTDMPDNKLINSIEKFQKDNDLKVDGIMKPGGETEVKISQFTESPTMWCTDCDGPHGGIHYPPFNICPPCWSKGYE
ncbi:peptidoglycan-binding domain-containing protein [Curvivirga sp.]|uniref:peptidoglycan-binding domain-containing protein n=1 Tax=Curvivirga sp. TaxID=2856848 RepID=UPI003B5A1A88